MSDVSSPKHLNGEAEKCESDSPNGGEEHESCSTPIGMTPAQPLTGVQSRANA